MSRELAQEIRASLVEGYLPCAVAFRVARKLGVSPKEVGHTANELKVRIISCQLGCFDYEKATHEGLGAEKIPKSLGEEVRLATSDSRLSCAKAFEIAARVKQSRRKVGDAATVFGIRLVSCQLGCF